MLGWWIFGWLLRFQTWLKPHRFHGRRKLIEAETPHRGWHRKKPQEVRTRIIHIKAMGPELSCREVAEAYNRGNRYRDITVGKTWVSEVIRKSRYEIMVRREEVRRRRLRSGLPGRVLGLDLTGKTDSNGNLHYILGAIDHGTRACLVLTTLKQKTTIAILRTLLDIVERHGKPRYVRTDNERVFTSRLFRFVLWLMGIRHQRIDAGCPWQNGRIERLFGSLKQKLDRWSVGNREQLEESLHLFRVWYNHVRPHQHLQGRTPAEAWIGADVHRQASKEAIWFDAWDGLLTGYYIRR